MEVEFKKESAKWSVKIPSKQFESLTRTATLEQDGSFYLATGSVDVHDLQIAISTLISARYNYLRDNK